MIPLSKVFVKEEFAQFARVWKPMLVLFLVAVAVRFAVFFVGVAHGDEHGHHPAFHGLDTHQYMQPALSMMRHGSYTIDSGGQQTPYFTRPAGYPWFIVTCYWIGGEKVSSILVPQIILGALACSVVYWIGALLFHHRAGLIAGLLMALDQTGIAYANKVMSETFCAFLLTGTALCFLLFVAKRRLWLLVLSGFCLGLSTLAHGSTLYFWVIPTVCLALGSSAWKSKLGWMALFVTSFFLTTAVWQTRNWMVFRLYQLSPKSSVVATTATRVLWYVEPHRTWDDVADEWYLEKNDEFSQQIGIPRQEWIHWLDPAIRRRCYPQYVRFMSNAAAEVFRDHFSTYSRMVFYSFLKISIFPLPYAELCRYAMSTKPESQNEDFRTRLRQAAKGLAHRQFGEFWQELRQVPLCKATGFTWNAFYWLATVPFSFVGAWFIFRRWSWFHTVLLLGAVAYFWVTTPIVMAGDGMNRYRLRLVPFLYCVAAIGWTGRRSSAFSIHSSGNPIQKLMAATHAPVYRSRLNELVRQITPHLRAGDHVLDVGCGSGTLGKALLDSTACPKELQVEGIERVKRGDEPIPVHEYNGPHIPLADRSFDVVIVADVLHHDADPERLLRECIRVSRRFVIVKDHQLSGFLAKPRICLLDWAANAPYGVPCLYRYNTPAEWAELPKQLNLTTEFELRSMKLYPTGVDVIFGGRLHYFAVYKVPR